MRTVLVPKQKCRCNELSLYDTTTFVTFCRCIKFQPESEFLPPQKLMKMGARSLHDWDVKLTRSVSPFNCSMLACDGHRAVCGRDSGQQLPLNCLFATQLPS